MQQIYFINYKVYSIEGQNDNDETNRIEINSIKFLPRIQIDKDSNYEESIADSEDKTKPIFS